MTTQAPAALDTIKDAQMALQKGQIDQAIKLADERLAELPHDREALYIKAVAYRVTQSWDLAREVLDVLTAHHPKFGRAWQELGHLNRDRGTPEEAGRAYARAVETNPALIASWKALLQLAKQTGQPDAVKQAEANLDRLARLPKELVTVNSFLSEDQVYKAERLCRHFLKTHPHHPEAMRLLARIGIRLNVLDDAQFLLESLLDFEPDNDLARADYVEVLRRRQKYGEALQQAEHLAKRTPDNPASQMAWVNALIAVGDNKAALEKLEALKGSSLDLANISLTRGHVLKTLGQTDEAIAAYRSAYQAKDDLGDAYWSLANLKTYRFSDEELDRMARAEAQPGVSAEDRWHLNFALGKAYEDRGDAAQAFEFYERGNALKKAESRYKAEITDEEFMRQKAVFSSEMVKNAPRGVSDPDPIFIVGLPRAGSTLLEQILASHSQVDGTLELPDILAAAHRLDGRRRVDEPPRYPGVVTNLTQEDLVGLGQRYLDDTRIHRQGAPFFTDKMPNNFRHIGLIKLILPNAKIIDARRDPMACCFSGYKQLFAEGQEFTYGLEEIGRYYKGYVELMAHWDTVFPGEILRVQYEDVVADLETQVRRILEYCDLTFESACIDFHQTKRAVRTASSEQVRQPINTKGLEQWRLFDAHLDPLRRALGPELADRMPEG